MVRFIRIGDLRSEKQMLDTEKSQATTSTACLLADVVSNTPLQNKHLLFLVEVVDDYTEFPAEFTLFVLVVMSQCLGFGEFNRVPHRLAFRFRPQIGICFRS